MKKKNILFLTDMYYPQPNANGLCVDAIVKELVSKYNVNVLCYQYKGEPQLQIVENTKIHRVKASLFFQIRKYYSQNPKSAIRLIMWKFVLLQRRITKLILINWYPLDSLLFTYRYCKRAEELAREENIDVVIGLYKPLTTAIALSRIAKKSKSVKSILYIVDSFCDSIEKENSLLNHKNWEWEKRIYSTVDYIINMECHHEQLLDARYNEFRHKMMYTDIPMLKSIEMENACSDSCVFDKKTINVMYCGSIYQPELFEKFVYLTKSISVNNKPIVLHVFGRNPNERIVKLAKSNERIIYHGTIDEKCKQHLIHKADALFSECPTGTNMIPSKLFISIGSCKKIIHVTNNPEDICRRYLKEYPDAFILDTNRCLNPDELTAFLLKEQIIEYRDIEKKYFRNTPKYTAEIIGRIIESDVNRNNFGL